jgi:hypothetical protein
VTLLDAKPARQEFSEMMSVSEESLPGCDKTRKRHIAIPEKIADTKIADICTPLVDAIAKRFHPAARQVLRDLMCAYMKRDKSAFESWLEGEFVILKDAFHPESQDTVRAIGYGTICGLASLWQGLHYEDDPRRKEESIRAATEYWERVLGLGETNTILTGYLLHRIRVWLGIAAYNRVDKVLDTDEQARIDLSAKLVALNAINEARKLQVLLKQDCAPLFYVGIFAAVQQRSTDFEQAFAQIQLLRSKWSGSEYFKARYDNFMNEPIVRVEMRRIGAAAENLSKSHVKPSGKQTKRA